jgi:hypothetical protein
MIDEAIQAFWYFCAYKTQIDEPTSDGWVAERVGLTACAAGRPAGWALQRHVALPVRCTAAPFT